MTKNTTITKDAMIRIFSTYSGIDDADATDTARIVTTADGSGEGGDAIDETASPATLDMTTEGLLRIDGERIEIEYKETELTGMEGSNTRISFTRENPAIVSMIRTGTVSTALVFEEGKRHICAYNSDYAAFEICVKANEVTNRMTENGGEITLDYGVEFRGSSTERTFVNITVSTTASGAGSI